jgi:chemotaxis protein CheC
MTPFSTLTEYQHDVLTETINIGFGRAAASLSVLVNQKVVLDVPQISVLSINDLSSAMNSMYSDLAAVEQQFSGGIQGDVVLIMDLDIASVFIDLLSGGPGISRPLTFSDREALLEVGNILLNAYIGSFGNLMKTQVNVSVPMLHMHSLDKLFAGIRDEGNSPFVLLVKTKFLLNNGSVVGHVALIIESYSLDSLFLSLQVVSLSE